MPWTQHCNSIFTLMFIGKDLITEFAKAGVDLKLDVAFALMRSP